MNTSRPGYTLFEILLVLAVVVIVAALSYPSLDSMYGEYKVAAAADQVRAAWASARAQAMEEGRAYRFAVVPGQGNFRVAPDQGDFWSGGSAPASADPANPTLILEDALPSGIRFAFSDDDLGDPASGSAMPAGSVDPGSWTTVVLFLPDGTASEDIEIRVLSPGNRPAVLRLRALTGVVTVRRDQGLSP